MDTSIIIPAHNEEGIIGVTLKSIEQGVRGEYEIVVVDDHSQDRTYEVACSLAKEFANIRVVKNTDEPGFASALKFGFRQAQASWVLPVMADLCDEPEAINRMRQEADKGFDIVCGSRYAKGGKKRGGPLLKTFFSRFVGLSMYTLIGIPTKDISNSFKLYRRKILENMNIESRGFDISMEIPLKAYFLGYKICEIPTIWVDRKSGVSKFVFLKHGTSYLKWYICAFVNKFKPKVPLREGKK